MDKRYKVFLNSTYTDLIPERNEIMLNFGFFITGGYNTLGFIFQ